MANGYGTMGGRRSRTTRSRTRRRTTVPRNRNRSRTSSAAGRQTAQMRQFQRSRPSIGRRNTARVARRNMNTRNASAGGMGKPDFIPNNYNNLITKDLPGGSKEHYYCKGNTITQDGCMKVQNTINKSKGYIAQPGTGFGPKSPGTRGRRRSIRR